MSKLLSSGLYKMKVVHQSLQCFHKLLMSAKCTSVSNRTFSSQCFTKSKTGGPFTSVSCVKNGSTARKLFTKLYIPNMCSKNIHTLKLHELSPSVFLRQKIFICSSSRFHTNQFMTPLLTRASMYSSSVTPGASSSDTSKSVLQVKRPARKKLSPVTDDDKVVQVNNVMAYAVAEDIDISGLEKHLVKQGLYNIGKLPQDVTYALHVRGKYNVGQKLKEIFVFEDGSVIFWCVPEAERGTFLKMLSKFSQGSYASSSMLYEREEIDFTFTSGKTCLAGDMIQLNENDHDSLPRLLEMYAFSNALAQSVKLAMWEASFNKFVGSIEDVTEDLRRGRKISMSRQQVLMKTGELFSLRHQINLSSDLLDTPDFYWDREALEPLYVSLCNYLSISRRTKVMNQKLNHCCELTELLSSHLNNAHHTRLEVMIIILILIEVIFEIVHSVEKYWNNQLTQTVDHVADTEVTKETSKLAVQ